MNNDLAIQTLGLTKQYPGVTAVESLDLKVLRGEIYGFLGLNGAGKTTTIRALLGMVKPSSGKVRILGEPIALGGQGPWHRVGHLVESPSAYPELTVLENLEIARRMQNVSSAERIGEVIEQLGLGRHADRRASVLSTGILQRLGLARALLHKPELLLLDEPANRLDPAGVVEIRTLLQAIARDEGVTVFMSSHILSEVDRLADRIGIIHHGRLIEEYDAEALEQMRSLRLNVQVRDIAGAQQSLESAGYEVELNDSSLQLVEGKAVHHPDRVATLLVESGYPPIRLAVEHEDLEEHFLRLTGGGS